MEIAYTVCLKSNTFNENDIYVLHNRLTKAIHKESTPYLTKEIMNNPYFRDPARWEHWVSRETAQLLVQNLGATYVSTIIDPNTSDHSHTPSVSMLPHVRQSNALKRADQIISLYNKLCENHPIRINLNNIEDPICLINLSWLLAICYKQYQSFGDINIHDFALNAMAHDIRRNLIIELGHVSELHKLKTQYIDEVDLATQTTVTSTLSYELCPDVVKSLLQNNKKYSRLICITDGLANQGINPDTINTHGNPKSIRQDIIANVVIDTLLPELLPEKIAPTNRTELNKLKRATFEKIKPTLEKDKEIRVTYQKIIPYDKTFLSVTKGASEKIGTNFGAFRKRFDDLLKTYLSTSTLDQQ